MFKDFRKTVKLFAITTRCRKIKTSDEFSVKNRITQSDLCKIVYVHHSEPYNPRSIANMTPLVAYTRRIYSIRYCNFL